MFPIAIIAGVIGAVVSTAQGASWVSNHLDSSKAAASAGGKGEAKPQTDAKATSFDATLAAQVAGQGVPASPAAVAAAPSHLPPPQHATTYDTLARTQAGIVAYSHVGEHHGSHARPKPNAGDGQGVTSS
jgi:hypothetical protein